MNEAADVVSEWAGVATTNAVDQVKSAIGSGTAVSSGSTTTTADGELVFGYGWVVNNASAGAGFTPLSLVNGDLDEYQIQTAAGPVAATFTQAAGGWVALMVTFRPAPPPPAQGATQALLAYTVTNAVHGADPAPALEPFAPGSGRRFHPLRRRPSTTQGLLE